MYGAQTKGTANGLTGGSLTKLRLVARNSLTGYGVPSQPIELTPASRPGPPGAVLVSLYGGDWLALYWAAPSDSGANDPSTVPLTRYMLEVDEHFGLGFVPLIEFETE